jgi:hypothetical protein
VNAPARRPKRSIGLVTVQHRDRLRTLTAKDDRWRPSRGMQASRSTDISLRGPARTHSFPHECHGVLV